MSVRSLRPNSSFAFPSVFTTGGRNALTRPEHLTPGSTAEDARRFLHFLPTEAHLQEIHCLLRPFLPDPDDDLVLELAFTARCRHVVTHNVRDFRGSEELGVTALTPREFLKLIRAKP